MTRRIRSLALAVAVLLVVAACGGTDDGASDTTATSAATTTTEATTTTTTTEATPEGPAMQPARVVFEDQTSDGTTIVVAEVELPSPGFVVIHADADGAPGPVIGHSELLPAGVSRDVVVTLDEPLTGTAVVWPMAHIDVNGNGIYEFFPPDDTTDAPALTAEGNVAVVSGTVTVESAEARTLTVAETDLGTIVVDDRGFTLYMFVPDEGGTPTCYDRCAEIWPPLVGDVAAGEGIDPSLIGSVERTDGTVQVTYGGWPLYYFANDENPGDTNGQGVNDVWFVIGPDGQPIMGS